MQKNIKHTCYSPQCLASPSLKTCYSPACRQLLKKLAKRNSRRKRQNTKRQASSRNTKHKNNRGKKKSTTRHAKRK